jgi:succinate dehydrogenase / fumarate reductase cytochrome b subunit
MSATAVNIAVERGFRFYSTTLGKKAIMALTGFILFAFVVGHLIGNLQVFQGPEKLNHYAELLRAVPAALWGARLVLLVSLVLHVTASIQLTKLQMDARPDRYHQRRAISSTLSSRTMIWSGLMIFFFVAYHLMHFTFGNAHPDFNPTHVYNNVIIGFQQPLASAFYIAGMILLGMHLHHGIFSMFQTLGLNHPRYSPWFKRFALASAVFVVVGNIAIPVAVLTGMLQLDRRL